MRGSPRSISATSGAASRTASRPLTPSAATRTRWPLSSSIRRSVSRASALSSTIRMSRAAATAPLLSAAARRMLGARAAGQVAEDLLDARRVGVDPYRFELLRQAPLPGAAGGAQRGERARRRFAEIERLALQHDLAGHGARRVEQIVGHAREMLHLP